MIPVHLRHGVEVALMVVDDVPAEVVYDDVENGNIRH